MSQFSNMQDVYGYHAYLRLRRGWKLLALALFGIVCSCLLPGRHSSHPQLGEASLILSLGCGAWGSLLAASGLLAGRFRRICLLVAANFVCLLLAQGSTTWLWGTPWLSLLTGLWMADRGLRLEMGMCRRAWLVPPGFLLGFILLPFFWPVVIFFFTVCLCIYLVFAYCFLSGAMPKADELLSQLDDPYLQAMAPITRI